MAAVNLVMSASQDFFDSTRDFALLLGLSTADLVRGAVDDRLAEPPIFDFESRSGPRVNGLRVHVEPAMKSKIVAAAEAQGLSVSRWLEAAIATRILKLLHAEVIEAKARAKAVDELAMSFRRSLSAVEAREGTSVQQAARTRAKEHVARASRFIEAARAEGLTA